MTQSIAVPRLGVGRIAIVGVGAVGSTTAYSMVQAGVAKEILLVDLDHRRAEGELMDLEHCIPFASPVKMAVVDIGEVEDCDLVIVTAGAAQRPGETRLNLVQRNAEIFSTIFPAICKKNPESLFLIVTNPVDVMTRVALKLSGLPSRQLFGSGTVLDTARFCHLISRRLGISASNVHAFVIGEHGDSEVMVWSRVMVGPFHVDEYAASNGIALTSIEKAAIGHEVRRAAYEIIERKGATHFAIGVACMRMAQSLTRHQHALYTLSRRFEGLYGLYDVCLSIPTLLSREGAVSHLAIELSDLERQELLKSAEVLDEVYQSLKL